jgi:hypothetical protein
MDWYQDGRWLEHQPPRAATIFTALGGLMFMFFALTGGLICRPPH